MELFSKAWQECSKSKRWSLVVELFFDDSGHERLTNESFLCLAGYMGIDKWWLPFVDEWQKTLTAHNMNYLHMRELVHLQGPYKKWTLEQRNEVLNDFIEIVRDRKTSIFPVSVTMDISAWQNLPDTTKKRFGVNADSFCFMRLIAGAIRIMTLCNPMDYIHIVTDTNPEFAAKRFNLYSALMGAFPKLTARCSAFTFANCEIYTPLQAADLLAWTIRKELIQKSLGHASSPIYAALLGDLKPEYAKNAIETIDKNRLSQILEEMPEQSSE